MEIFEVANGCGKLSLKRTEFYETVGTKKYGNQLSLKQKNTLLLQKSQHTHTFVAKITTYAHFGRKKQGLHKHKRGGVTIYVFSLSH